MAGTHSPTRPLLVGSTLIVAIAVCLLVLASPLALGYLDDAGERDWQRLSEIGQTYGAVSALLAAIALGGVAASLALQARSARLEREHAFRSVHLGLVEYALGDPELLECFAFMSAATATERRQNLYCNQVYQALEMGFAVGAVNESFLRSSMREVLTSPAGRRWWSETSHNRPMPKDRTSRRVRAVMDEEWAVHAVDATPAVDETAAG